MAKASSNEASHWKNLVLEQMDSGLSIPEWCRQKGMPIHNFRYWHKKFNKKFFSEALGRSAFIEMNDQQKSVGFHLECQGVKIRLDPQFDLQALQRCLEVIRKC